MSCSTSVLLYLNMYSKWLIRNFQPFTVQKPQRQFLSKSYLVRMTYSSCNELHTNSERYQFWDVVKKLHVFFLLFAASHCLHKNFLIPTKLSTQIMLRIYVCKSKFGWIPIKIESYSWLSPKLNFVNILFLGNTAQLTYRFLDTSNLNTIINKNKTIVDTSNITTT